LTSTIVTTAPMITTSAMMAMTTTMPPRLRGGSLPG
jgi:hypothetical protein